MVTFSVAYSIIALTAENTKTAVGGHMRRLKG